MKSAFFIVFASLFFSAIPMEQEPLTITLTNIKTTEGNIRIGIYEAKNDFPNENDTYKNKVFKISKTGTLILKIKDLPYGKYAIGLYQDKNNNKKLDTNFFGAPKEPFAFSNNIRPRFSAPSYKDCEITYSATNNKIKVNLLNY
jgi:uncharacterized protein (DUF2141 family)